MVFREAKKLGKADISIKSNFIYGQSGSGRT